NFPQYMASYRLGFVEKGVWRYLRWFHNHTSRTFCPTASIRSLLVSKGFERIGIWGRGVDSERFDPARRDMRCRVELGLTMDDIVFVYCGRLAAEKNLPLLMSAFRSLADPRARLLIIGDGPLRTALLADADERVVFAGYRHGEDLARLYAAADAMVFPSVTETFGNVILEAMASGLPVVGFQVSGPQDIVLDGQTGKLVGETTVPALARAMEHFLNHREDMRCCGIKAREYAQQQNWQQVNEVVRQAYRQICQGVFA
ncbi:MAG: glycosyltransferase family 1 protein, partial [Deltaproteobacteria bacterium]|nr:glycosyltransferase family 1 protein [Deltaproteobacteria bacterium]